MISNLLQLILHILRKGYRRILLSALCFTSPFSLALPEFTIHIQEHLFSPAELHIPVDQKVKITFINHDSTPEEIDSFDLNREKVVFGNSQASIFVGPLKSGNYHFFGEYHPNSATGIVVVDNDTEPQDGD